METKVHPAIRTLEFFSTGLLQAMAGCIRTAISADLMADKGRITTWWGGEVAHVHLQRIPMEDWQILRDSRSFTMREIETELLRREIDGE